MATMTALTGYAAELQIPVWAEAGEILTAQNVSAAVNDSPTQVLSVNTPTDDLMLLVVLDLTDDLAAVQQARDALTARINQLPANHFVGVLNAQNGLNVLTEPSADREAVAGAIQAQPVGGLAGLLNTVERAAQIGESVIKKSGVRLAILYLTDSDVCSYRENFCNAQVNGNDSGDLSRGQNGNTLVRERISRMVTSLNETSAPVFISHLSYRNDNLNVAYQTGLINIATATGGSATISRSIAEIPTAINETIDRILSHSTVTVELPADQSRVVGVTLTEQGKILEHRSDYVINN